MSNRDEELGMLIRQLQVPEHGPEFFSDLDARLEAEAEDIRLVRHRRARRSFSLLGTAAAILVGILFATWVGIPGRDGGPSVIGPRVASAAEVQQKVAQAFSTTRTLQANLATRAVAPIDPLTQSFSFATNAAGDFAYESSDGLEKGAFTAADGILKEVRGFADEPGRFVAFEDRGQPLSLRFRRFDRELGSVVRAFLQDGNGAGIQEVIHEGRPAWRVSMDVTPTRFAESADHLNIVVDRETGFPVDVEESRNGAFLKRTTITGLRLNQELPPERFQLAIPGKPALIRLDKVDTGFRRVPPGEAAAISGYPPLIPQSVPKGFEGPVVAVAKNTFSTGDEGANPPSVDVTDVTYRRGLDRLAVTTYRTGPNPGVWTDPISAGESTVESPTRINLSSGFLKGAEAFVVIEPGTPPHVWLVTKDLVVTVSGDLSREELIKTVQSLQPVQ